jgi:hypothetical protein
MIKNENFCKLKLVFKIDACGEDKLDADGVGSKPSNYKINMLFFFNKLTEN